MEDQQEQAQQLIEYLATKGFFLPDLYDKFEAAGLRFTDTFEKSFGDEAMKYRLDFEWDLQFGAYRWTGYKASHWDARGSETERYFRTSCWGIAHADLAYHIMSGRLDHIRKILLSTGIAEYTHTDLNNFLEKTLSSNPQEFICKASKNDREGMIDFEIAVLREGRYFQASEVKATFVRYPEIRHGVFNGVDSAMLEERMKQIDWERDDLYEIDERGFPYPGAETQQIIDDINLLISEPESKQTGLGLQLKYWPYNSSIEAYVDDRAWELYHSLPKMSYSFALGTGAQSIYNLMCGRPVLAAKPWTAEDFDKWNLLVPTAEGPQLRTVTGPSVKELETYLTMLPLDDLHKGDLIRGLLQGDDVATTLYGLKQTAVVISVDLTDRCIKLSTPEGQPIPYNFKLEQEGALQKPLPVHGQSRQPMKHKKNNKRKGKGL